MAGAHGRAAVSATQGLLRTRPYHLGLAAFIAGLIACALPLEAICLLAGALATALAAGRMPIAALALAAALVAGGAVGAARKAAIDAPASKLEDGTFIEATASLVERPRPSKFGSSAPIDVRTGPLSGLRLQARASGDLKWPAALSPGAELLVTGSARTPRVRAGADFDYPAYLRRRGVAGELALEGVRATGRERGGAMGAVDAMRRRAESALGAGVSEPSAALIRGMVLGQDEAIATTVRDDFRRSGLAHILAVSGQNVMLLGALALPVLASIGLGGRARLVAVIGLIFLYVPLAGAGPSLQRAGIMGAAGLLAVLLARPASRWYALLLAAALTLTLNPRVHGDPGWQLSFAAVIGILVLGPPLRRPLEGLPRVAAEGIAITLAATLATAPLLAHHFQAVSIASLPANVLALPVVAPAMWIGMVQIAVGQLSAVGPLSQLGIELAELLGSANGLLLGYLEALAGHFAGLPGAQVEVSLASPAALAGAYLALGAAGLVATRAARRLGPAATAELGRWRTAEPWRRRLAVGLGIALVAGVLLRVLAPPPPPDELTVSFLDVGQGDATLVQHPDGGAILFDGGPEEARVARLLRAAGVRRLSAVVATHASADHHGGLREVLDEVTVDLLVDGGDGTADPEFRSVLMAADRAGVRRIPARAGQTLRLGGMLVRILSPESRPPGPPPEDPNPRAVVAVVSAGSFDLFLSGDAESPSLLPLQLPDVEAMKVPHHGSADPGLPALLDRLRPEIAAIEVGEDNAYGHPTPSTLAALEASGAAVYRTDEQRTIRLVVESGHMNVSTED